MEVQILILSHKRAGRVTTHRHVSNAQICIPESQAASYRQHHLDETLVMHPDSVVGLPAKRQWVYEKFGDVMMLDDDSMGLLRIYRKANSLRKALCSADHCYEIIQRTAATARDMGVYLFGFGSHANPVTYNPFKPFRMGGYSPGGAMGMLAGSKLWFPTDTTLPLDDYWICLLNAYYHRFAFYDSRFAFGFRETYTGQGGMSEFRQDDAEQQATDYLKKWFGDAVVKKRGRPSVTKVQRNRGGRSITIPWLVQ